MCAFAWTANQWLVLTQQKLMYVAKHFMKISSEITYFTVSISLGENS